ncbi:hypothetical protein QBC43DRAFT_198741 [Cladorrhinum sp. PSN259]|nr:hypothetical protein QBC43DRAFT_198741 [Cladorrhinum sp. PSN259]
MQADHQPLTPRYVNTRRHNLQHSVFYRLPNAVIARLMVMLDPVSLQCLRRTGHIFFQAFEQTFMLPLPEAQDWPFPKPPLPFLKTITDAECQALISILRRDELCLNCREARGQPNWSWRVQQTTQKYLHCSGCRRDHPVLLFTPAQRRLEPRLCVGHTGHIRLCEHEVVKWTQIVAAAKMKKKMGRVVIAECKKKSHFRSCQHHRLGTFWERFGHDNYTPQLCPENPRLLLYLSEGGTLMVKLDWSPHLDIRPIKTSAYPAGTMNQMLGSLRQQ